MAENFYRHKSLHSAVFVVSQPEYVGRLGSVLGNFYSTDSKDVRIPSPLHFLARCSEMQLKQL